MNNRIPKPMPRGWPRGPALPDTLLVPSSIGGTTEARVGRGQPGRPRPEMRDLGAGEGSRHPPLPGPAFDELDDVEVAPLAELTRPRDDIEGLVVANEPVPLDLLPRLRIVANYGVGYDRIDVRGMRGARRRRHEHARRARRRDCRSRLRADAGDAAAGRRGRPLRALGRLDGSWSEGGLAEEVSGSTLGIVGLGRIGSAVARRARGFDAAGALHAAPARGERSGRVPRAGRAASPRRTSSRSTRR